MDENMGVIVVVVLLGVVVGVFAGMLVGAVFLRWSVRILQGFRPPFGRALLVVFLATVASYVAFVALVFAMQAAGMYDLEAMAAAATPDPQAIAAMLGMQVVLSLVSSLMAWLATAVFVKLLVEKPEGGALGFGRSLLVSLLYVLMMTALVMVLVVLLALGIAFFAALYAPN